MKKSILILFVVFFISLQFTQAQKTKKEVKNKELWQQLDQLMEHHEVQLHWVKGHSGDAGNEMADLLANKGIDSLT